MHRSTFRNTAGLQIGELATAHRIQLAVTPLNRREWQRAIEVIDAGIRSLGVDVAIEPPSRTGIERRIGAIRARLAQQRAVERQRSLFDGRADVEALERERVVATLDASLSRIVAAVASPVDALATRMELVAAWSERDR